MCTASLREASTKQWLMDGKNGICRQAVINELQAALAGLESGVVYRIPGSEGEALDSDSDLQVPVSRLELTLPGGDHSILRLQQHSAARVRPQIHFFDSRKEQPS